MTGSSTHGGSRGAGAPASTRRSAAGWCLRIALSGASSASSKTGDRGHRRRGRGRGWPVHRARASSTSTCTAGAGTPRWAGEPRWTGWPARCCAVASPRSCRRPGRRRSPTSCGSPRPYGAGCRLRRRTERARSASTSRARSSQRPGRAPTIRRTCARRPMSRPSDIEALLDGLRADHDRARAPRRAGSHPAAVDRGRAGLARPLRGDVRRGPRGLRGRRDARRPTCSTRCRASTTTTLASRSPRWGTTPSTSS